MKQRIIYLAAAIAAFLALNAMPVLAVLRPGHVV